MPAASLQLSTQTAVAPPERAGAGASASSSIECPLRNEMSRRPERGAAFAEPRPTTIAFVVVGVAPVPVLAHAVTVALCGAATASTASTVTADPLTFRVPPK